MMKARELVDKLIEIAVNYKTVYMWGVFGSPVSEGIINEKANQYPDWYNTSKQAQLRSLIGKKVYGFDCVNLMKGVLWGWNGNPNAYHGGAKYNSNGVPDVSADGMINLCKDVKTTDFDKMLIGEALWMPGHWGVYIGDGLAVESTPAWKNGVQITAVGNIGNKAGYNTRRWSKHGKIPYVIYEEPKADPELEEAKKVIKEKAGLADNTIKYLYEYKYGSDLLKKLAKAMK